jgi:uncharacterized LabA/DUF88 family protein
MIPTMYFIDGSNLLIELAKKIPGCERFRAEAPHPSAIITVAKDLLVKRKAGDIAADSIIRSYWFASYQGDDQMRINYARALRMAGFEPRLFQRIGAKEKGVDIDLTREMLVNAFARNFKRAVLVAGDADYVSLVNEVKRYGVNVYGSFFSGASLADELHLALDRFHPLDFSPTDPAFSGPVEALVAAMRRP